MGLAVDGVEGFREGVVPFNGVAEALLLEDLEGLGGLDDVIGGGVVLKDGLCQCPVACAYFDNWERGEGFKPTGDGLAEDGVQGCGGGEVAVAADFPDLRGIVAEVLMEEGCLHELFKG